MHNHITATYYLLMKKSLKQGTITIDQAYECKNDLTSLMRRQPRFKNLQSCMPDHLKLEIGTIDLDSQTIEQSHQKNRVSSMPARLRQPGQTKLNTIGASDEIPFQNFKEKKNRVATMLAPIKYAV